MAQKRNTFKHRRRAGSNVRNRVVALVVVLLLIGLVFFLLGRFKSGNGKVKSGPVVAVETQKMPERMASDYSQGVYTAAQQPAASKPTRNSRPVQHGSIAIIVDDMGASMKDAKRLLAINMPVTFAIIPGLAHSQDIAEVTHAKGRGVMVHMPMEPQGYPQQRVEKNGLLLSQSSEEIAGRVKAYLQEIPHATGANNHMGSSFTEREDKMFPVLDVLKRSGMFFVDSRTSSRSVGYSLAVRMGLQAGTRNIFLDNDQSLDKVRAQLNEAARMATKRGSVIAICHPHPGTIQALEEMMPELRRDGITFVYVAQLVR